MTVPHYFFHTADGERDLDHNGTELPDNGADRRAGVRAGVDE